MYNLFYEQNDVDGIQILAYNFAKMVSYYSLQIGNWISDGLELESVFLMLKQLNWYSSNILSLNFEQE